MAKIKLGASPKNFKKTVTFPMLDGTTGSIEVNYIYRTRKAFGALVDQAREDAVEKSKVIATDGKFTLLGHLAEADIANADYVMQIADGWDVDAEFTHESVEELNNELPAAVTAIVDGYRVAITEGSLGN